MRATRRQQGERGAAALSLLTVGILVAIGIVAAMSIPLTEASDAKAKSNSAADAAALAGVEYVKNDLQIALNDEGWLGNWEAYDGLISGGVTSATSYAEANEARLVSYKGPTPFNGWTAHAEVEGRTVEGEVFTSDATARLDLPDCTVKDDENDGPAEPPEPGAPSEKVTKTVDCGGLKVDVEVDEDSDDGEGGPPKLELPDDFVAQLIGESKAKLVD
jgi:hypothetical protein